MVPWRVSSCFFISVHGALPSLPLAYRILQTCLLYIYFVYLSMSNRIVRAIPTLPGEMTPRVAIFTAPGPPGIKSGRHAHASEATAACAATVGYKMCCVLPWYSTYT